MKNMMSQGLTYACKMVICVVSQWGDAVTEHWIYNKKNKKRITQTDRQLNKYLVLISVRIYVLLNPLQTYNEIIVTVKDWQTYLIIIK